MFIVFMYLHFLHVHNVSNDVRNSNKEYNSEHDCPMTIALTTCIYNYNNHYYSQVQSAISFLSRLSFRKIVKGRQKLNAENFGGGDV